MFVFFLAAPPQKQGLQDLINGGASQRMVSSYLELV